jgi:hypothetical protein
LVKANINQFDKIGIKNIHGGRVKMDCNSKLNGLNSLEQSVLITMLVFPFQGTEQIQLVYIGHHHMHIIQVFPVNNIIPPIEGLGADL